MFAILHGQMVIDDRTDNRAHRTNTSHEAKEPDNGGEEVGVGQRVDFGLVAEYKNNGGSDSDKCKGSCTKYHPSFALSLAGDPMGK